MRVSLVDHDIYPIEKIQNLLDGYLTLRQIGAVDGEEMLIDTIEGVSVLMTTSRLPVTRRVLASSDLELVAKIGTGLDSVDLDAAAEEGVAVTYTPGLNALAVAEHTVTLLLAASRHLPKQQGVLRAKEWRDEAPLGRQVSGSTIGIVGFGNVGQRVAGLLSGFHVDVLAHDPYVYEEDTELVGAEMTSLKRLLSESDVVCVNAQHTKETRHMIDADALARMKRSSLLVNTARGPIVDERALINALRDGEIAGAGLDVFETEPLPADSPLRDMDNVVLTPHIAGATSESRHKGLERLTENVRCFLDGDEIPERYVAVMPE